MVMLFARKTLSLYPIRNKQDARGRAEQTETKQERNMKMKKTILIAVAMMTATMTYAQTTELTSADVDVIQQRSCRVGTPIS